MFGLPKRRISTRTSGRQRYEGRGAISSPCLRAPGPPNLMMTETQKTRRAILRAATRNRSRNAFSPRIFRAIKHRFFPLGFFLRNILALRREPRWQGLTPRLWRGHLHRMLEERSRIFLEIPRGWAEKEGTEQAPVPALFRSLDLPEQSGYCSHCGGCCEIASGFPSFPRATSLPLRWQQLFGAGLGEGHRFCAFLWEFDASGRSMCAIHPWRPAPCRAFAEAECAFLKNDLNKHPPYRPQDFSMACQRLSRLVDRR